VNDIEKAVSFACSMMQKGTYMGTALSVAANYYKVNRAEVQRGVASRSGKSQKGKKRPSTAKPPMTCGDCGKPATWKATATYAYRPHYYFLCDEHKGALPCWADGPFDSVRWSKYKTTSPNPTEEENEQTK
jgi:hypothetical protein